MSHEMEKRLSGCALLIMTCLVLVWAFEELLRLL